MEDMNNFNVKGEAMFGDKQCGLCGCKTGLLWNRKDNCYVCVECNHRLEVFQ